MTEPESRNSSPDEVFRAAPANDAEAAIVCGTDFSEQAMHAVEAASALAKRLNRPLVLAHAVDRDSRESLPADVRDSLCLYERAQLHEERERLHAADVQVVEAFLTGRPETVLIETAEKHHACLLVVSSHGRKGAERWLLGSVAEQVAERASLPTLLVRDSAPFAKWVEGKKQLRVFVGADFSEQSEAALRWAAWLQQIAPCLVIVAHLEPIQTPPGALETANSSVFMEMLARTDAMRERAMRQRVREILGTKGVRVRIEKGWGRSDAHLIEVAREELADLIVVGTHQRHGFARVGHRSVSRGVLHYAPMNVACVPVAAPAARE